MRLDSPRYFSKLPLRDSNFFELFNQLGGQIVSGAHALMKMMRNCADVASRERYAAKVDRVPGTMPTA